MDKETLSNYGWVVVLVLILAVLLALATPFGSFVSTAIKDVTGGFWDVNSAALNVAGIKTDNLSFSETSGTSAKCGIEGHFNEDGKEHGIPAENCTAGHTYTCECDGWVIPEGCSYYIGMRDLQEGFYFNTAEKSYTAGQQLPCGYKIQNGDVFVDNHYRYEAAYADVFNENTGNWDYIEISPRWILKSVSDKSLKTYGEIRETILSAPVIGLYGTFEGCESLETAPAIPNTVTYLYDVFHDCTSLKTAPVIPNSVTELVGTFFTCTSLTTVPNIPNSVTYMTNAFAGCTSLTEVPAIPNGVTELGGTFAGCTSLKIAPAIPESVTEMSRAFSGCTSLTTVSSIPCHSVALEGTFENCTSLTGTIVIDNLYESYYANCFTGTVKPITLTGTSTMLRGLSATGNNGNVIVMGEGSYYCPVCGGPCNYMHP